MRTRESPITILAPVGKRDGSSDGSRDGSKDGSSKSSKTPPPVIEHLTVLPPIKKKRISGTRSNGSGSDSGSRTTSRPRSTVSCPALIATEELLPNRVMNIATPTAATSVQSPDGSGDGSIELILNAEIPLVIGNESFANSTVNSSVTGVSNSSFSLRQIASALSRNSKRSQEHKEELIRKMTKQKPTTQKGTTKRKKRRFTTGLPPRPPFPWAVAMDKDNSSKAKTAESISSDQKTNTSNSILAKEHSSQTSKTTSPSQSRPKAEPSTPHSGDTATLSDSKAMSDKGKTLDSDPDGKGKTSSKKKKKTSRPSPSTTAIKKQNRESDEQRSCLDCSFYLPPAEAILASDRMAKEVALNDYYYNNGNNDDEEEEEILLDPRGYGIKDDLDGDDAASIKSSLSFHVMDNVCTYSYGVNYDIHQNNNARDIYVTNGELQQALLVDEDDPMDPVDDFDDFDDFDRSVAMVASDIEEILQIGTDKNDHDGASPDKEGIPSTLSSHSSIIFPTDAWKQKGRNRIETARASGTKEILSKNRSIPTENGKNKTPKAEISRKRKVSKGSPPPRKRSDTAKSNIDYKEDFYIAGHHASSSPEPRKGSTPPARKRSDAAQENIGSDHFYKGEEASAPQPRKGSTPPARKRSDAAQENVGSDHLHKGREASAPQTRKGSTPPARKRSDTAQENSGSNHLYKGHKVSVPQTRKDSTLSARKQSDATQKTVGSYHLHKGREASAPQARNVIPPQPRKQSNAMQWNIGCTENFYKGFHEEEASTQSKKGSTPPLKTKNEGSQSNSGCTSSQARKGSPPPARKRGSTAQSNVGWTEEFYTRGHEASSPQARKGKPPPVRKQSGPAQNNVGWTEEFYRRGYQAPSPQNKKGSTHPPRKTGKLAQSSVSFTEKHHKTASEALCPQNRSAMEKSQTGQDAGLKGKVGLDTQQTIQPNISPTEARASCLKNKGIPGGTGKDVTKETTNGSAKVQNKEATNRRGRGCFEPSSFQCKIFDLEDPGGDGKVEISEKRHLTTTNNAKNRYHEYKVPKKSKGTVKQTTFRCDLNETGQPVKQSTRRIETKKVVKHRAPECVPVETKRVVKRAAPQCDPIETRCNRSETKRIVRQTTPAKLTGPQCDPIETKKVVKQPAPRSSPIETKRVVRQTTPAKPTAPQCDPIETKKVVKQPAPRSSPIDTKRVVKQTTPAKQTDHRWDPQESKKVVKQPAPRCNPNQTGKTVKQTPPKKASKPTAARCDPNETKKTAKQTMARGNIHEAKEVVKQTRFKCDLRETDGAAEKENHHTKNSRGLHENDKRVSRFDRKILGSLSENVNVPPSKGSQSRNKKNKAQQRSKKLPMRSSRRRKKIDVDHLFDEIDEDINAKNFAKQEEDHPPIPREVSIHSFDEESIHSFDEDSGESDESDNLHLFMEIANYLAKNLPQNENDAGKESKFNRRDNVRNASSNETREQDSQTQLEDESDSRKQKYRGFSLGSSKRKMVTFAKEGTSPKKKKKRKFRVSFLFPPRELEQPRVAATGQSDIEIDREDFVKQWFEDVTGRKLLSENLERGIDVSWRETEKLRRAGERDADELDLLLLGGALDDASSERRI